MIKSGNPALSKKSFENLKSTSTEIMTLDGTVNKTAISMGDFIVCGLLHL